MTDTFSGVWKSSYKFYDKARDTSFWSQHLLRARRRGDTLVFESIPEANESYMLVRLHLDHNLATGSWREETSKEGYYEGLTYIGATQFVISEDATHLVGKYIVYGRYKTLNDGPWELQYLGDNLPDDMRSITTERPVDS